ncbi:hypothetical protein ATO10_12082 [Actibacterium atlanticum]|uniref:Uncharacterized protein n=2 Tax=Actibacterium atlanticum TaxID=1461693 RepID=A0A058ZLI6_9RHOB|nr:hypothetical protein ATO10_12082 [Actibacterium atlanticum]
MRTKWHMQREEGALTIARQLPPRFDVEVTTRMPKGRKGRLAHLIRQDLWRAMQRQRGFSPVVRVEEDGSHLLVRAGGRILARTFPVDYVQNVIKGVLEHPENRARWAANARIEKEKDHA